MKRIVGVLLTSAALLFAGAAPALAHGEEAQEAWLRMNTTAFWGTTFSGGTPQDNGDVQIKAGEEFTITGTVKVMETWPKTLDEPRTGFINVASPGPVVLMKNRVINGEQAPHSIYISAGSVYNFELTLQARIPGRYHIHPTLASQGAGQLLGPGQWYEVVEGDTAFTNPVTLYNNETVNLENYKVWWVFFWTLAGFILGMIWLLWWIWPKPTVTRLAITAQLSVNDDGGEAVGLVTKRDHRAMDAVMLATIALTVIGLIWQASAYPDKIPLQVQRFRIDGAVQPAAFGTVKATKVLLNDDTNEYTMTVNVQNTGTEDVTLNALHLSSFSLAAQAGDAAVSPDAGVPDNTLAVTPATTVAAGQTTDLELRMPLTQLSGAELVPRVNANSSVAGVLEFSTASGAKHYITVQKNMNTVFALGR